MNASSLPAPPSFRLDGKRALVAGASSGIGLAAAAALADAGARVTLAARRPEPLAKAVAAIRDAGGEATGLVLDVADPQAVADAIEGTEPFDVLVNSAGLARHAPALETRAADYDAVMRLNVRGAYFLAQAVARRLAEAGRPGSIITVSSQMGHVGGRDRAVYCASKHAVEGFTKAMAIEWGAQGIRVNTVCPTFVRTPLTAPTFDDPEKRAWVERSIPMGRAGEVEDMTGPIVFLASEAASLVTGAALMVDGGWTAV